MRKYYEYIKNSFKESMAYRVEYFTGIGQTILGLLVMLYLWRALLGQSGEATTDAGIITLADMTTYILVAAVIWAITGNNVIRGIHDRVRTGQITTDLIKPLNFTAFMFCQMVGGSLFSLIFRMVPILAIGIFLLNFQLPSLPDFLFFCVSVFSAFMLQFLISFSLGILAFWFMTIWQVEVLSFSVIQLFSGNMIPLWFFPETLVKIANYLPFRMMFFVPISVYLGKVDSGEFWFLFLQQIMWVAILYLISRLMWRAAVKKLVIQGG